MRAGTGLAPAVTGAMGWEVHGQPGAGPRAHAWSFAVLKPLYFSFEPVFGERSVAFEKVKKDG